MYACAATECRSEATAEGGASTWPGECGGRGRFGIGPSAPKDKRDHDRRDSRISVPWQALCRPVPAILAGRGGASPTEMAGTSPGTSPTMTLLCSRLTQSRPLFQLFQLCSGRPDYAARIACRDPMAGCGCLTGESGSGAAAERGRLSDLMAGYTKSRHALAKINIPQHFPGRTIARARAALPGKC